MEGSRPHNFIASLLKLLTLSEKLIDQVHHTLQKNLKPPRPLIPKRHYCHLPEASYGKNRNLENPNIPDFPSAVAKIRALFNRENKVTNAKKIKVPSMVGFTLQDF